MQKLGDFTTAHDMSDAELEAGLAHVHVNESVMAAHKYAMLDEAERRGLGMRRGYSSVQLWFSKRTRVAEGNAAKQIALGRWLSQHRDVAIALSDATIHPAHANAIADAHANIRSADPTLDDASLNRHVAALIETACNTTAAGVTQHARHIAHRVAADAQARHDVRRKREEQARREREEQSRTPSSTAPDPADPADPVDPAGRNPGSETPAHNTPRPPSAAENTALNYFEIVPLSDGRGRIEGNFDALTIETLRTALSPLTKPQRQPDGSLDPRLPRTRNADGFVHILDRYLHGGQAGSRPAAQVVVTVGLSELLKEPSERTGSSSDAEWPFRMEWTGPISAELAELLMCDAAMTPVIVDEAGVPLVMGRDVRVATYGQRKAVIARDRCCIMCGAPAGWCQVHHIVFWEDGGTSDLGNFALVCGRCHRMIHFDGWVVAMGDDGHPYSIPPAAAEDRRPVPSYHRRRRRTA